MLFRWAATYQGGLPLVSAIYPTADHWVPARWFVRGAAEIDAIESGTQLRMANAGAHGKLLAEMGGKAEVKRITRKIHRRAFPQVWRRKAKPQEV